MIAVPVLLLLCAMAIILASSSARRKGKPVLAGGTGKATLAALAVAGVLLLALLFLRLRHGGS